MKTFTKCAVILFILIQILFAQKITAQIVGSDITYECVQGQPPGTFRVRLVVYKDCTDTVSICSNCNSCTASFQVVGANPSCNGQSFGSISANLVNVRDVNPNPECPNTKSVCTNAGCVTPGTWTTPAIERYEFEGIINLNQMGIPANCCSIRLSYSNCCRNSSIKTGSNDQNFYTEAVINRCLSSNPCNSSPTISNDPYAVVCGGQPYYFNNGVVDPDLDSLSYAFTPSLQSAGTSVTYISPYSFDAPMPWTGPKTGTFPAGIKCDPLTGDIMFTSPISGSFIGVLAVEVKQWKRIYGVPTVIGKTRRDIQMYLLQCPPNHPPALSTRPSNSGNQPKVFWEVCAGQQLCFDIIAKDTDFDPPLRSDTTSLAWNGALTRFGATFTRNYNPTTRKQLGPREDDWKFCWMPHDSLASATPYYFTATAKDDRCPLPAQAAQAFSIRVLSLPDVALQKTNYGCGKWKVGYSMPPNNPNQTFVLRSWHIAKEPYDYAFASGAYNYNNVQETPVVNFAKGGKYLVKLNLAGQGPAGEQNCVKTFYDTLVVDTFVTPVIFDTSACLGDSVTLTPSAKGGIPPYTYRWFNNINDTIVPLNKSLTAGQLTVSPTQTRKYTLQVKDVSGCRAYDSITVFVKKPSSSQQDVFICIGASYNFNGTMLTQDGTYYDTIPNATGCDSVITLTLMQKQTLTSFTSVGICTGGSYNFNGTVLTQSGIYTDTMPSAFGCDSVVTLTLSLGLPVASNANMAICAGTSYNFNGTLLTQEGVYIDTMPSHLGCDSVITLHLSTKQRTASTQNVTACEYYNFNGRIISQSGTYNDTVQNSIGCDSVIMLNLMLKSASLQFFTKTICQGTSYNFNGKILIQDGWYYDTLQNTFGCDSVIVLRLTVRNINTAVTKILYTLTAVGDSITGYRWLDCNNNFAPVPNATLRDFTPTQSGDYAVAITMLGGCTDTSMCYNITFTSLNELLTLQNQIHIYPNPAKDVVTIGNLPQGSSISIIDVMGREMMKLKSIETEVSVSISEFVSGIYFVRIEHNGNVANKKFVVGR